MFLSLHVIVPAFPAYWMWFLWFLTLSSFTTFNKLRWGRIYMCVCGPLPRHCWRSYRSIQNPCLQYSCKFVSNSIERHLSYTFWRIKSIWNVHVYKCACIRTCIYVEWGTCWGLMYCILCRERGKQPGVHYVHVSKVPKIWVFLYMYVVLSIDDCIIYLFALFRGSYDGVQCCLVILLWHTCSTEESINIKLLYFYRVCTSMFPSSIWLSRVSPPTQYCCI